MKLVSVLSQFQHRFGLSLVVRRKRMSLAPHSSLAKVLGSMSCALLVFGLLSAPVLAADQTVTVTADSGAGSLRQAITDVGSGETITFAAGLAGQTITLASELVISKNLTIDASALTSPITLSGGGTQRIIRILATYTATLRGLRFLDGYVAATYGGAIYSLGTTTVDRCTFTSNESLAFGGGIANSGVMNILNSTFHDNIADQGGAIYTDSSSSLTVTNSTFTNNEATNYGGAIFSGIAGSVSGERLELFSVTIVGNEVTGVNGKGGGVYNDYLGVPIPQITNSIVSLNASEQGPDVFGDFVNTTSFIGGDAKLSPLGNYGGPTQTMRPLPDSPVIDFAGATSYELTLVNCGTTVASNVVTCSTTAGLAANMVVTGAGIPLGAIVTAVISPTQFTISSPATATSSTVTITLDLPTDQRGQPRMLVGGLDLGAVEVPFSAYNETGLTIHTRVTGSTDGEFQISTDPNFSDTVTTYAGTGISGKSDGPRLAAQLSNPAGVAVDSLGNVFIADSANHRICMVSTDGQLVTIAGSGTFGLVDGAGVTARFAFPGGLAVGPDDNVYVADTYNHSIRKLTRPSIAGGSWAVTTHAGAGVVGFQNGSSGSARFNFPYGLTLDSSGNVYVADTINHRIRLIDTTGNVSTYAGTGVADSTDNANASLAEFNNPRGIVFLSGSLYVADTSNDSIRKIVISANQATRTVSTLTAPSALNGPSGIATNGSTLYVSDEGNFRVCEVVSTSGVITPLAGTSSGFADGEALTQAQFRSPAGIAVDKEDNLIVADYNNHRVRGVAIQPLSVPSSVITDVVPDVTGDQLASVLDVNSLGLATGVTYYIRWKPASGPAQLLGQSFYLYDFPEIQTKPATNITPSGAQLNANVDPKNGRTIVTLEYSTDPDMLRPYQVGTTAGSGVAGFADDADPNTLPAAQFSNPSGVVTNAAGDIFVADRANHRIRKVTAAGVVTTFAGSGVAGHADNSTGALAQFELPEGLAIDASGNLYVADTQNHCIRKVTPLGEVSTIAGTPRVAGYEEGAAASAKFLYPTGVAVDAAGNVYVADSGNNRIRMLATDDQVSTYAGNGVPGFANGDRLASQFKSPKGIALGAGNALVVADTGNHMIRVIEPTAVTTLAGDGSEGFVNGPGANAQFSSPEGIARDASGVFFVTDTGNHRIRMITDDGTSVTTLAGSGVAGYLDSPSGELHPATVSKFNLPLGITVDASGNIYVTQQGLLRKIARMTDLPAAIVTPDADGTGARDVSALVNLPLRYGTTYYFRARATSYRTTRTGVILSFATTQAMEKVFDGASTSAVELTDQQTEVVDFGSTPTSQSVLRSLTIFNPGTAPLTVSSVTLPAGFQLSGSFGVVAPGTSATTEIELIASTAGSYSGSVVIASDAPEQPSFTFSIAGLVLDPPFVLTLDATDVAGTTATFNSYVNPMDSSTTAWFEWSQDIDFDGVTVSTLAGSAPAGFENGAGNVAKFDQPSGLAVDADGNTYVADTENHRIRKIEPDGTTSTFAGSGTSGFANGAGATAQFNRPIGIVINSTGMLFVADSGNHCIRSISSDGASVATFSGLGTPGFTDGIAGAARFSSPSGLAIDSSDQLYVADTGNHRVRKVALNGSVSTLAGTGTAGSTNGAGNVAEFDSPYGIARDNAGFVYVTENSHAIRRIAADGTTTTFAGVVGTSGSTDGSGASAQFTSPAGLAIAVDGSILVADKGNNKIRRISAAGAVKTIAGTGTDGVLDGVGDVAQFSSPTSVAVMADGTFIVAEMGSSTIRTLGNLQVLIQAESGLTGTDLLSVIEAVTGLPSSGTYYYRVIATNGGGTVVGNTISVVLTPPLSGYSLWQSTYFGVNAGNNLVAGPAASPAGDGVANLLKYAFDLNPPTDSAAGDMPKPTLDAGGLSITYTKVLAATDITYTVQWSANLIDWYDNANPAPVNNSVITEVEVPDPDPDTTQFKATVDDNSSAKFLRVRVTQNP